MRQSSVLMCRPPSKISGNSAGNDPFRKIDLALASDEWQRLHDCLKKDFRLKVEVLPAPENLPWMSFAAGAGVTNKRTYVRSSFRRPHRCEEERHFENWFRKKGFIVKTLERPLGFQGEREVLEIAGELYIGYRFRSETEGHEILAKYLKKRYFALEIPDERFYDIDTCLAPLGERTALVYLGAFEPYAQMILRENIPDLIRVSTKEALRLACNLIEIGGRVILPEGCPQTREELERRKFKVTELDFSEWVKLGGAAKSLVLRLR
ncbi:MAG: hypothetical protein JW893_06500 [Candidatus Omnitrophica bacterium]|nr:hypothetical protein [Candidatus Omnitrophota bacterium]